jgi:NAD(P)-dependent dehydrogenase (short-subunit alcohol dehydrogenase family)
MELDIAGKTAVVTGASRGIGLAIVQALVSEGVRVVAGARNITPELKDATSLALSVDLSTPAGPAELVDYALAELGGIDILVNNLGGPDPRAGGFLSVDDQGWLDVFNTNLFIAVRATRAALPSIIEREGSVVNIGTTNAHLPIPVVVDYSAAKAALLNLGKALAEEFGPRGVRVNTVSAGPVLTDAWTAPGGIADSISEQSGLPRDQVIEQVPAMLGLSTGRTTRPEEIASVVVFLASRKAANISGAEYIVDGGFMKTI